MTTDHISALRSAVAAHKAATDAVAAESKRLADERARAAAEQMAVHGESSPAGKEKTGNA